MIEQIIGIDCATVAGKQGLARAFRSSGGWVLGEVVGSPDFSEDVILSWLRHAPTLLALDAPLGWPRPLGDLLWQHRAGEPLPAEPSSLFLRHTDQVVYRLVKKRPLEVGADRIARTAHWALRLLGALRLRSGQALPLAWDPGIEVSSAIEVYPAGTLAAYGVASRGYRDPRAEKPRRAVIALLAAHMQLQVPLGQLLDDSHGLDAAICVLAGIDFLSGRAVAPDNAALARREGWIWVKG